MLVYWKLTIIMCCCNTFEVIFFLSLVVTDYNIMMMQWIGLSEEIFAPDIVPRKLEHRITILAFKDNDHFENVDHVCGWFSFLRMGTMTERLYQLWQWCLITDQRWWGLKTIKWFLNQGNLTSGQSSNDPPTISRNCNS